MKYAAVPAAIVAVLVASLTSPAAAQAQAADPRVAQVVLACADGELSTLTDQSALNAWSCAGPSPTASVTVGTRTVGLPPNNSTVTASTIIAEGAPVVDEVTVARAEDSIAVRIGEGPILGAPEAAEVLRANSAVRAEEAVQLLDDFSVKCSTVGQVTAYNGRWESRDYRWWYNPTNEPSTASVTSLVAASSTLAEGESTLCGNWTNRAELTYLGRIFWEEPQVSADGGCGTFSSMNTVGWGPLDNSGTLAVACTWRQNNFIVKSDIKFDTSARTWNTSNTCAGNNFDVQGIATHEFGHSMGLEHVFQESQQVMKPASPPCDLGQRQLGYGDQRNLVVSYN